MPGGGGGSQDSNTTTTPWSGLKPELLHLYEQARALQEGPDLQYFPGSTVAGRNPYSSQATANVAGLVADRGLDSAIAENQRTLSGEYLSPDTNPYLRQVGESAAQDVTRNYMRSTMPMIASRFAGAGRSAGPTSGPGGSAETSAMSAANRDLGQELSQLFGGLYGGAYESERGRMQSAQQTSIGLRERQFADQSSLAAAGRDEFQHAQLMLSDMVQRFNFDQYQPYEKLGAFQQFIQSGSGFANQSTQGSANIGALQMAGLGIGGLGAAGQFAQGISDFT